MKTVAVAVSLSALAGTSAFTPSGFMGSSVVSRVASSNSKIEMIFGAGKKSSVKTSGAKAGKAAAARK